MRQGVHPIPSQLYETSPFSIEFELSPSINSISASDWDACLEGHHGHNNTAAASSPFLEHAWIRCMEESNCASPETGWIPQHVTIRIDGLAAGYVPLYIKGHSMGEFIFDTAWADAAYQSGIQYYPKLLVGVPFTPVTGSRILLNPKIVSTFSREQLRQVRISVGEFLSRIAHSNGISSVHINFLTDEEAADLVGPLQEAQSAEDNDDTPMNFVKFILGKLENKYFRRTSMQYHWINSNAKNDNKPYESFEDYLRCFKSKRRINIRRERNKVTEESNVRVDAVIGQDILKHHGLVDRMYEIYVSTVGKMMYGRQYLSIDFFRLLVKSKFLKNLCFICARRSDTGEEMNTTDVFAGTFNIVKDGVFYGRYWGCLPEMDVKNLHFETCYWSAIEFCIDKGLWKMEPGAGGGDYKWARGFDPVLVHSTHYICDNGLRSVVGQAVREETKNHILVRKHLLDRSVVGQRSAS
eukprot:CAMPEP_0198293012 /NCGR_PEP_ID=MMETSP1449-20131203/14927_1 /TAXON_ID=420275 /ORGANISM="Attheya septentrionalis, Strain CCMP2084" /LENGTH=466 /DNA_ID=CAMNT_0043992407 /DNA_START=365 /DNA_END=1765 /DNA_ORIENTATION=+